MPRLLVLSLLLLLTACGDPSDPPPAPEPTVTPAFASDEEALAAAVEAYSAYLAVSDAILADGGANPERIYQVATSSLGADEIEGFAEFQANGFRSVGRSTFDDMRLQSFSSEAIDAVRVYVCVDVSEVDVVDASGKSIVAPDRQTLIPFEMGFDRVAGTLLLSSKEIWDRGSVCSSKD